MRVFLLTLWVLAVGCVEPCIRHSDCPNQLVCQLGACVMPAMDGDVPDGELLASDGATDADLADVADATDADVADATDADVADATDADVADADVADATDADVADAGLTDATDAAADADADIIDAGVQDAGLGRIRDAESFTDVISLDIPHLDRRLLYPSTPDAGPADAGDGT
ncbi:MAG: hypothetical protein ACI9KE_001820 [Polyangiales bacterium]|jgi:hypothetical protein